MPDDDIRDLGIEWLASQLGESDSATEREPAESEEPLTGRAEGPAAVWPAAPGAAPTPLGPVASGQPAVSPEPAAWPAPAVTAPAWHAEDSTVALPVVPPPAPPAPDSADAAPAAPPSALDAAPTVARPVATPTGQAGGFAWGLTPTGAPDPKLEAAAQDVAVAPSEVVEEAHIPEAPARPAPAVPAEVPPAPEPAFEAVPATRVIRSEADLEPAPWWTTPAQTPLVPTAEEAAATQLLRTPGPAASVRVAPLPPGAPTLAAPVSAPVSAPAAAAAGGRAPRREAAGDGRTSATTRTLIWIAAGLLGVVVLVGLFFLGQRLVGGGAPVAAPSATLAATATPTPTPTPTAPPAGPQAAGVHAWDTLRGGECLEPYTSPWAEKFTVVDCAAPHAAQLVHRGVFAGDASAAFPGEAGLAAQINLLCTAPGVIDLAAAGAYPDLQVQGSYPITAEQWTSGPRHYYCFVSRSSAEPLTASIAGH
ncbi:MAG TPA: hypothetical protein VFC59_07490 [Cryobacterium sp.]|nr:hypothetical protein [Cryobacterium sp.]